MENHGKDVQNQSRRDLLKKAYKAPVVVALGTMAASQEAKATWWFTRDRHSSNSSSSLTGTTCNRCFRFPCCC